jgi:CubicO group peptidase (beta-lactamase class C family)
MNKLPSVWLSAVVISASFSASVLASAHSHAGTDSLPLLDRKRTSAVIQILNRAHSHGFSGSVLIAENGKVRIFRGIGTLRGVTIQRNSRFWIASSGKQFVSAAIMLLVDRHELTLNDSLGNFLPECPEDKREITVLQLLSHTSGFAQSYVSEEQTLRAAAIAKMLGEPLAGAPGDTFRYSNTNIQLAAAIVEQVSGSTYSDFVTRNLFTPADMKSTGFAGSSAADQVSPITGELPQRLRTAYWGEQGAFSSAGDLFRWYSQLRSGRILTKSSGEIIFKPVAQIKEGHAALGWFIGTSANGEDVIFTRGNEDFGANSLIYAYPSRDVVIIILTHAGEADPAISWSRKLQHEIATELQL